MNNNYKKRVSINSNTLKWEKLKNKNVCKKILSKEGIKETALIKINKNSVKNDDSSLINSVEIFVLEGTYVNEFGSFEKGTYLRLPKEREKFISSESSCLLFRKTNYFSDDEKLIVNTNTSFWSKGHGNLEVMGLGNHAALVKWPKNERFVSHSHWGGEEVFVLSGLFMDEHGSYEKGNWTRSPHLSKHFPYVEEETIIFVKTGHLV